MGYVLAELSVQRSVVDLKWAVGGSRARRGVSSDQWCDLQWAVGGSQARHGSLRVLTPPEGSALGDRCHWPADRLAVRAASRPGRSVGASSGPATDHCCPGPVQGGRTTAVQARSRAAVPLLSRPGPVRPYHCCPGPVQGGRVTAVQARSKAAI